MLKAPAAASCLIAIVLAVTLPACAPVHQDSAQSALADGRLDDAAYQVQAALEHDPDNMTLKNLAAQIYTRRGAKEFQNGQMIAASEDFHRAIDYVPTYAQAYDYLGMLSFQQHNWADAIKYGSMGAGYSGEAEPAYVQSARQNQKNVDAGYRPFSKQASKSSSK
jgi:tetratricopeptide (TPR) repeat protein